MTKKDTVEKIASSGHQLESYSAFLISGLIRNHELIRPYSILAAGRLSILVLK